MHVADCSMFDFVVASLEATKLTYQLMPLTNSSVLGLFGTSFLAASRLRNRLCAMNDTNPSLINNIIV
jgi:hypothetical protein